MKQMKLYKVEAYILDNKEKQILKVMVYKHFRQALNDVLNGNMEDVVSEKKYLPANFNSPTKILFTSVDNKGRGDDMSIRYEIEENKYLAFYIGELLVVDGEE